MSDWTEPRVVTEHEGGKGGLEGNTKAMTDIDGIAACLRLERTAGELAQAVELLKLAQGHMLEMAPDMPPSWPRSSVSRHNSLTKLVFKFLEAHTPQHDRKIIEPVAVWSARQWAATVQWSWEILKNGERVGVCSKEAAPGIVAAMNAREATL